MGQPEIYVFIIEACYLLRRDFIPCTFLNVPEQTMAPTCISVNACQLKHVCFGSCRTNFSPLGPFQLEAIYSKQPHFNDPLWSLLEDSR